MTNDARSRTSAPFTASNVGKYAANSAVFSVAVESKYNAIAPSPTHMIRA
jgi:hypothetical protein